MGLFLYYAGHSFINQLRKLFKTWVLIFILACALLGGVIGAVAGTVAGETDTEPETAIEETAEQDIFESAGLSAGETVEAAAGAVVLAVFAFMAVGADKNGSKIFQPADVNLLFASPMRPQAVLMFRLSSQLGVSLLASLYLLIQLPNLVLNAGLSLWAALALLGAWCLTIAAATLIQVLLYLFASSHPRAKPMIRRVVYGLLLALVLVYLFLLRWTGAGYLKTAVTLFGAPVTRFIPLWGWLKGLCGAAVAGELSGALLYLGACLGGIAVLIFVIRRMKCDFYEDAMAKSEETAELLERASSEKASGVIVRRKKDRSGRLRRDGMGHGWGANVYFFKTLYNRFRFAHLGFLTKTMELYLAAAVALGLLARNGILGGGSFLPAGLVLAGLAFFRSLGNPLEQDTSSDWFVMIPESPWAKLFWSLLGGMACCLLDVLPAILAAAVLTGVNVLAALAWVPLILSVDFYATCVGAFIGISVPVSAGKLVKQLAQIMFVYFGLVPDAIIIAAGYFLGGMAASLAIAAAVNFVLGILFFALTPLFIEPKSRPARRDCGAGEVDLRTARRRFSRLGMGMFAVLAVTSALQVALSLGVGALWPDDDWPEWALWLSTFAPMYLMGVPIGLFIMRKVPAVPPEVKKITVRRAGAVVLISIFLMYAGNILGTGILALLQSLFGTAAENPVASYVMEGSLWARILVMVVLAPIIEEYLCRKTLIDRMRPYGEKLAVVASALIFGLFHGNLSQFFYAFFLGLLFGCVYEKTGRLRWTACLHMFINFMGGVAAPAVLKYAGADMLDGSGVDALLSPGAIVLVTYVLTMFALALGGLVALIAVSRQVRFGPAALELPRGTRFRTAAWNPGMVLFFLGCLALTALSLIP